MIIIHRLEDQLKIQESLAFINKIAFQRHGCKPPPAPEILFAAYDQCQKLIGTIALDFSKAGQPLPLEKIWEFDQTKIPFPFIREEIAQYGRWMSDLPGLSIMLLYVATVFAITRKKKYFFAETKPKITKIFLDLEFPIIIIPDAQLALDKIPAEGKSYYLAGKPDLLMMRLDLMQAACLKYVTELESINFKFKNPAA